jgi:acetyltransferase-like isoleucine patch superfamily enzyme
MCYNYIYRKILKKINLLRWFFISALEITFLKLKGVVVGKDVVFKGRSLFQLVENSSIIIGDGCRFNSLLCTNPIGINHRCMISTMRKGANIIIGKNCGFSGVSITAFDNVTIGESVRVGANSVIMDGDFHLDDPRTSPPAPIIIKDNVWLGYGVVVMKGVTIGENSVIGVNSIVTKDIPANVIAAGNPCKVIRSIEKV